MREDRDQDERQADHVADQADDPGREHLVQRLDVVGQPGHQPPDRRAIEERGRQRHHVAVDTHAQVVHAQLADHLREVELREGRAVLADQRQQVQDSRGDRGRPGARRRCARRSPASAGTAARPPAAPRPAATPPRPAAAAVRPDEAKIRRSSVRSSALPSRSSRRHLERPPPRPLALPRPAARGRATRRGRPTPAAPRACPRSATRPPSSTRIWSASFTAATRCEIRIDVRPRQDRPQARQDRPARSRRRPTTANRRGSGSAGRRPARAPAPPAAAARPTG